MKLPAKWKKKNSFRKKKKKKKENLLIIPFINDFVHGLLTTLCSLRSLQQVLHCLGHFLNAKKKRRRRKKKNEKNEK